MLALWKMDRVKERVRIHVQRAADLIGHRVSVARVDRKLRASDARLGLGLRRTSLNGVAMAIGLKDELHRHCPCALRDEVAHSATAPGATIVKRIRDRFKH